MSIINDPTKGRKYRRQLTVLVMVLFVFCRSIFPIKGGLPEETVSKTNANAKAKVKEKSSKWTKEDFAALAVIGVFAYAIYEFVDAGMPSSAERTKMRNDNEQRRYNKEIYDRQMMHAQQQERQYEQDRQRQKEAY